MQLVLSTGNIVADGTSLVRQPGVNRSNFEFTRSLRTHFADAQDDYAHLADGSARADDDTVPLEVWTAREGDTLYIPRIEWDTAGLQEEPSQYEITVKLFFLPQTQAANRNHIVNDAINLVLRELGVKSIDLLIASFPGIWFEGDCPWAADKKNAQQGNDDQEAEIWAVLEDMQRRGTVKSLGIAEFGSEKLAKFLQRVKVRPTVDQINIRDCCNVPPPLVDLAKKEKIELLVHTDCIDILPSGTLRELLGDGPNGAAVVTYSTAANRSDDATKSDVRLHGDLLPQWVVKYTAVVKNRGVIENKGYFAGAELVESALAAQS